MLILSRRKGQGMQLILTESLPPGTILEVFVTDLRTETVRIGIEAPKSIKIVRAELKGE